MLPPTETQEFGDSQETVSASKLQNMQEQQNLLLAEVRNQLATFTPPDPKQSTNKAEQQEREEKRRRLEKLLAEIEKRINAENSRPKKRYVSPATMEKEYAVYHDALRRAIEDRGTENFPTSAGKRLYGELTMIVTINHDGRVLSTEVVESSGNPVLDRRAAAIARSAGPFGSFTKAMRREMDQMAVVSRFKFTRDETLEAKVSPGP
jgi:protein TonB